MSLGFELGETEDGLTSTAYPHYCKNSLRSTTTSVDILEIFSNSEPNVRWYQGLNHDALLRQSEEREESLHSVGGASLCVFFLNITPTPRGNHILLLSPATLNWLRKKFGLSLVFLDCLVDTAWGAKPGNACYERSDDSSTMVQTDAFYHLLHGDRPCHIWMSHNGSDRATTYIIFNCPARAKLRLLQCAASSDRLSLLRPMVIDTFLADATSEDLKACIQSARGHLLRYEEYGASQIPSEALQDTFQNLHALSQTWHVLHGNLIDLEEVLAFIINVHRNHISKQASSDNFNRTPNYDAMEFLSSRNQLWKRWVGNYNTRTQVQINLYFNLASQSDNRINIEIAHTSKRIAEATLKDSSSMITIAAMTMLFLPGTFVSAIFSMTFFTSSTDASGDASLSVLPQWWYFPVATIPLTILVVGCWRLWQQKRNKRVPDRTESEDRTSPSAISNHTSRLRNLLFAGNAEESGLDCWARDRGVSPRPWSHGWRNLLAKKKTATTAASMGQNASADETPTENRDTP